MKSYFSNVPVVKYEGPGSNNVFAFKFYNPKEIIMGKSMEEHLRFSMSWWHTLCGMGTDPFGAGTIDRSYGETDPIAHAKAKADAAFEFMSKLGIRYFCFHDADIAPEGADLADFKHNLGEVVDYIKLKVDETGIKPLWGTANCFTNPRYMHGAGTSPYADAFACAAAQIKNAIDATMKLGGKGYVFWGGREGYETLLNTDMGFELDNMARLLHMAVDYARVNGFDGEFFIEPKPKEPSKHQYDFDTGNVLAFLRKYGLEKDFKLNIESNHATLAGHTFQHELRLAAVNGMLGSVDANQGDVMLGWDTDQFPTNVYETTMCMYEILKNGGFTYGGLNFDAKLRRGSYEFEDLVHGYISGMDSFALGLRMAAKIIEDGRLDSFVQDRYSSYKSGIGADIVSGKSTLESLESYAMKLKEVKIPSGRQEFLENILNGILFGK
ncbi:MAG: xylose isomerase [Ruminiclostridium sp.]